MAALLIERYDKAKTNPQSQKFHYYTPKDLADWLKDTAAQRLVAQDPNNVWGHGFATLPNPAPMAKLLPEPITMKRGDSANFTVDSLPTRASVKVVVNAEGDAGNLSLTSVCPALSGRDTTRSNRGTFTLKACTEGEVTIRIYKAGTKALLKVYKLKVTPRSSVVFPGLVSSMAVGDHNGFVVAASGLTPRVSHTLKLTASNRNIRFTPCSSSSASRSAVAPSTLFNFTPTTTIHSRQADLYACGATSGTVTARVTRGGATAPW